MGTDDSLQQLVDDLTKAGFKNSDTDKIIIAAHQYCDGSPDYSGVGNIPSLSSGGGCDTSLFSQTQWKGWIQNAEKILNSNGAQFKWILTEGNVRCTDKTGCVKQNGKLFSDFLKDLQSDKSCMGYTIWMLTDGDSYGNAAMGTNQSYRENYSGIYSLDSNQNFKFPL